MDVSSKKIKVLFVCSFNGARSLLAYEFSKIYLHAQVDAYCCSFDNNGLEKKIINLIQDLGIKLSVDSLPSIFEHLQNAETFDYVVTLCNPNTREDCESVIAISKELVNNNSNILLLPVNDFLSIDAQGEQWMDCAREIRDTIKSEVQKLMHTIEATTDNHA